MDPTEIIKATVSSDRAEAITKSRDPKNKLKIKNIHELYRLIFFIFCNVFYNTLCNIINKY